MGSRPRGAPLVSTLRSAAAEENDPLALRRRIASLERTEEGLRAELESLRSRYLALLARLPSEHVRELARHDAGAVSAAPAPMDLFTGWVESTQLTPSDVATELQLLWQRSPRPT